MLVGMRSCLATLALILPGLIARAAETAGSADVLSDPKAVAEFENQVRPVLSTRCLKCHGPQKQESNLRLDSRAAMMQGGDSGPAVVPGKPEASLLVKAIRHEGDIQMPPDSRLKDEQITTLSRWVAEGARWPEVTVGAAIRRGAISADDRTFWSFQPVKPRPAPEVEDRGWVQSPVDRWILAAPGVEGDASGPSRRPSHLDPSRHIRPDWIAARPPRRSMRFWPTPRRTPSTGWSSACWPPRPTASVGGGTGSMWSGTPIPLERPPITPSARPTSIAIM